MTLVRVERAILDLLRSQAVIDMEKKRGKLADEVAEGQLRGERSGGEFRFGTPAEFLRGESAKVWRICQNRLRICQRNGTRAGDSCMPSVL